MLLQIGQVLFQLLQPFLAGLVLFFLERLSLNLQLHGAPVDFVQLGGLGVDLHTQPRGRLVDQVNRLVRQVPVGDVAVTERRCRYDGRVLDAHAMVYLISLLQPAEDTDRVFCRRLIHVYRLESPLQCGILLYVLAVFVQRRRANGVQFAPGQHRLEHVAGIHRAFSSACSDDCVQLVDEQDDLAGGVCYFFEHRL